MLLRLILFIVITFTIVIVSYAQNKDTLVYEQLHMFRIKQENDLYQKWYQSDKDFTDGFHIELAHDIFFNKPAEWFLIGFKNTIFNDYSLSLGQDIFTPENTQTTEIDSSDRPYSALLYFTYTKFSNQFFKGRQLFSNFYLGLNGRYAFGDEIQNGVHKALGNKSANGWHNQLSTGLMFDYDVTYSQLLPIGNHFFEASFFGKAHVGTIFNYAAAGVFFKIGHYTDSYINENGVYNPRNKTHVAEHDITKLSKAKKKLIPKHIRQQSVEKQVNYLNKRLNRKFQFFIYLQFETVYTFYDGTSEGSLIQFAPNKYELNQPGGEHTTLQGEYGINLQYNRLFIDFNRFIENNVYEPGELFGFGEIAISYIF